VTHPYLPKSGFWWSASSKVPCSKPPRKDSRKSKQIPMRRANRKERVHQIRVKILFLYRTVSRIVSRRFSQWAIEPQVPSTLFSECWPPAPQVPDTPPTPHPTPNLPRLLFLFSPALLTFSLSTHPFYHSREIPSRCLHFGDLLFFCAFLALGNDEISFPLLDGMEPQM
jgi:hypothetical protein